MIVFALLYFIHYWNIYCIEHFGQAIEHLNLGLSNFLTIIT